ncbi:hypothetical protein Q1695_005080 [Nippostrongylus brasiliensis]|nr:hypothetical protein Q1695_005080 [Nippostrongylus brasiliensis]
MSRNIRTLNSIRKDDHDSGEESDGGGERQGFFVGGSEHSGQQVLGPDRGSRGMAERVFDAARQHGAEALHSSDLSPRPQTRFGGGGVRLGESSGAARDNASSGESDGADHEEVVVELHVWENGFSIDDGPLRSFEEPESRQFLTSIMQGRVPPELLAAHPRRRIDLRMQKRSGPYEPPKLKPFQGANARLGAVVPQVVSSAPEAPSSSASSAEASVDNVAKAQSEVKLDGVSPTTQVQIRLPSGQRIKGTFNHAHTVEAIRNFLVTAFPDMAATPFQFMTTFPNKVIDDESSSLKDAGLINAVVVVKLCA